MDFFTKFLKMNHSPSPPPGPSTSHQNEVLEELTHTKDKLRQGSEKSKADSFQNFDTALKTTRDAKGSDDVAVSLKYSKEDLSHKDASILKNVVIKSGYKQGDSKENSPVGRRNEKAKRLQELDKNRIRSDSPSTVKSFSNHQNLGGIQASNLEDEQITDLDLDYIDQDDALKHMKSNIEVLAYLKKSELIEKHKDNNVRVKEFLSDQRTYLENQQTPVEDVFTRGSQSKVSKEPVFKTDKEESMSIALKSGSESALKILRRSPEVNVSTSDFQDSFTVSTKDQSRVLTLEPEKQNGNKKFEINPNANQTVINEIKYHHNLRHYDESSNFEPEPQTSKTDCDKKGNMEQFPMKKTGDRTAETKHVNEPNSYVATNSTEEQVRRAISLSEIFHVQEKDHTFRNKQIIPTQDDSESVTSVVDKTWDLCSLPLDRRDSNKQSNLYIDKTLETRLWDPEKEKLPINSGREVSKIGEMIKDCHIAKFATNIVTAMDRVDCFSEDNDLSVVQIPKKTLGSETLTDHPKLKSCDLSIQNEREKEKMKIIINEDFQTNVQLLGSEIEKIDAREECLQLSKDNVEMVNGSLNTIGKVNNCFETREIGKLGSSQETVLPLTQEILKVIVDEENSSSSRKEGTVLRSDTLNNTESVSAFSRAQDNNESVLTQRQTISGSAGNSLDLIDESLGSSPPKGKENSINIYMRGEVGDSVKIEKIGDMYISETGRRRSSAKSLQDEQIEDEAEGEIGGGSEEFESDSLENSESGSDYDFDIEFVDDIEERFDSVAVEAPSRSIIDDKLGRLLDSLRLEGVDDDDDILRLGDTHSIDIHAPPTHDYLAVQRPRISRKRSLRIRLSPVIEILDESVSPTVLFDINNMTELSIPGSVYRECDSPDISCKRVKHDDEFDYSDEERVFDDFEEVSSSENTDDCFNQNDLLETSQKSSSESKNLGSDQVHIMVHSAISSQENLNSGDVNSAQDRNYNERLKKEEGTEIYGSTYGDPTKVEEKNVQASPLERSVDDDKKAEENEGGNETKLKIIEVKNGNGKQNNNDEEDHESKTKNDDGKNSTKSREKNTEEQATNCKNDVGRTHTQTVNEKGRGMENVGFSLKIFNARNEITEGLESSYLHQENKPSCEREFEIEPRELGAPNQSLKTSSIAAEIHAESNLALSAGKKNRFPLDVRRETEKSNTEDTILSALDDTKVLKTNGVFQMLNEVPETILSQSQISEENWKQVNQKTIQGATNILDNQHASARDHVTVDSSIEEALRHLENEEHYRLNRRDGFSRVNEERIMSTSLHVTSGERLEDVNVNVSINQALEIMRVLSKSESAVESLEYQEGFGGISAPASLRELCEATIFDDFESRNVEPSLSQGEDRFLDPAELSDYRTCISVQSYDEMTENADTVRLRDSQKNISSAAKEVSTGKTLHNERPDSAKLTTEQFIPREDFVELNTSESIKMVDDEGQEPITRVDASTSDAHLRLQELFDSYILLKIPGITEIVSYEDSEQTTNTIHNIPNTSKVDESQKPIIRNKHRDCSESLLEGMTDSEFQHSEKDLDPLNSIDKVIGNILKTNTLGLNCLKNVCVIPLTGIDCRWIDTPDHEFDSRLLGYIQQYLGHNTELKKLMDAKDSEITSLKESNLKLTNELKRLNDSKRNSDLIERKDKGEVSSTENHSENQKEEVKTVMREYEEIIAGLMEIVERDRGEFDKERQNLQKEVTELITHLNSLELAFNDIHLKYEKSKIVIAGFKSNEELLKQCISDMEMVVINHEKRYHKLKEYATSELSRANEELDAVKRSYESKLSSYNDLLKKCEVQLKSLQDIVNQKMEENTSLMKICDDLIKKMTDLSQ